MSLTIYKIYFVQESSTNTLILVFLDNYYFFNTKLYNIVIFEIDSCDLYLYLLLVT